MSRYDILNMMWVKVMDSVYFIPTVFQSILKFYVFNTSLHILTNSTEIYYNQHRILTIAYNGYEDMPMEPANELPLYSSRITNTYIEYLTLYYPDVDIDAVLKYAKMTRYEVEDPGHWFTQAQVDRFQEKMVEKTGNLEISRNVGRSVASAESMGAVRQYGLGLMGPLSLYLMIEKLHNAMTKAATTTAKKLGPNRVEIVVTPHASTKEKPYQCENRKGTFESLAKPFIGKLAHIEEPKCYHKGDDRCQYIIDWISSPAKYFKRFRNITSAISICASIILFFIFPIIPWLIFLLSSISVCSLLSYRTAYLEKKGLYSTIEVQGNAAKELVEEIDVRHNHALLVQKIGQITSTIMNIDQLTTNVMDIIKTYLDFDRGLILLANKETSCLNYNSSYRHNNAHKSSLKNLSIDLNHSHPNEILTKAFNNHQPYLINDIKKYDKKHTLDISFFIKLESAACICIPIIYEKKSLGILALDNTRSKKILTKSDMSLLMGIASQIAVGINNTIIFNKLEEHKKELQKSRDQLEQRVEERTAELKQVNTELSLEIEERQKTETRLRASIKEKEILVREVYHRVKNNLQIIASLLDMTKRRAKHPETVDMLSEAHAKLYTMSLIHTQLYQSDRVDQINMGRNLHDLVDHLEQLYGQTRNVTANIDTESFYLSVTQAVPCALALNEIISNAIKYAYPGRKAGNIEISQKLSKDDVVTIKVKDHGAGIPDSVDIEHTDTLGLKLVRNLIVKQLNGDLRIHNRDGTEILIEFKATFE